MGAKSIPAPSALAQQSIFGITQEKENTVDAVGVPGVLAGTAVLVFFVRMARSPFQVLPLASVVS